MFEAHEEPLNRSVAVKTLRRGHNTRVDLMERFLRERKILARLHHTHIVPIYAAGQEGALLYFAMPYIQGAPLNKVVETARNLDSTPPGHATPTLGDLAAEARTREDRSAETKPAPAAAAVPEAAPPRKGQPAPLALSMRYLQSVAQAMADVALAVHHAHQVRIVHRDLKPSNIMIDTGGYCWVLDFGLASVKAGLAEDGPLRGVSEPHFGLSVSGAAQGTPTYMAPEQHDREGTTTARTDVWGLGVTVYELLTLRRAFQTLHQILDREYAPVRPCQLVLDLPRDLEAICLKAIKKDPSQRYQSALELAEDLRRWLKHEPITARPARPLRRLALWSKRNRGWAAAIAVTAAAILALGVGGMVLGRSIARSARMETQVAQAEKEVAQEHVAAAEEQARQRHRESLLQTMQRIRLTSHASGWSVDTSNLVRQAAAIRPDLDNALQSQAAAALIGLDARISKGFENFGAYSVAFDSEGKRLLVGTTFDRNHKPSVARIWDRSTDQLQELKIAEEGPVGFRADGTPIQLVLKGEDGTNESMILMDLARERALTRFTLPDKLAVRNLPEVGMTPDGLRIAAPVASEEGKVALVVWDGTSGKPLHRFSIRNTSAAFAPDGSLVACGTDEGRIKVWSLRTGQEVANLKSGQLKIHCLAFSRGPHRGTDGRDEGKGWLLAAGDAGAVVTVWDLETKIPRSYCLGGHYDVYAVKFSPDGMTLAGAGRNQGASIWDVATGRQLLQ